MSSRKPISERPSINQIIRQARKDLKLNQAQVAEKMGMKVDTYSKKERFGNITIDWALEFANAVGVDPAIFSAVFEAPKPQTLNFTPETGEVFTFKTRTDGIDRIYGKPKDDDKKEDKNNDKNPFPFTLNATEKSLVETFHYLSKSQQNEILTFANEVKERGR